MSAAQNIRTQLTLFLAPPWRERLDLLRATLDPVQASLIATHVTLCREDEIAGLSQQAMLDRLAGWTSTPLRLSFGQPQRFHGHGILLPCVAGLEPFQQLREHVLQDQTARKHGAHITLAHPRNPRPLGNTEDALIDCPQSFHIECSAAALIEHAAGAAWRTLWEQLFGQAGRGEA